LKLFKVTVDGQSYTVEVEEVKSASSITPKPNENLSNRTTTDKQASKENDASVSSSAAGGTSIKAPMPGSVIDVKVKPGDIVQDGDVLIVLEAMKMENELTSSIAGTVTEVLVKKGDTVNSGDPLVIIA